MSDTFTPLNPNGDKPIIQANCTFPTYLRSTAWGSHGARAWLHCASSANKRRHNPDAPSEETNATKFGTLYHSYLLDGREKFLKSYVEINDAVKAEMMETANTKIRESAVGKKFTKALAIYKEWVAHGNTADDLTPAIQEKLLEEDLNRKLLTEAPSSSTDIYKTWCQDKRDQGQIPVPEGAMETIIDMAGEMAGHKECSSILRKKAKSEVTIFAPVFKNGKVVLWIKARPDWLPNEGDSIWDLKTAEDASPEGFGRAINNYGYYFQLAFHLKVCQAAGLDKKSGGWLVQEKTWPYECVKYDAEERWLASATKDVNLVIKKLAKAEIKNDHPGYPNGYPQMPEFAERILAAKEGDV